MGGGTFSPLKAGRAAPEKAKQAEIPVAGLRKILDIPVRVTKNPSQKREAQAAVVSGVVPQDMANWPDLRRFVISITVLAVEIAYCPA
jgi:hypothetical protein